MSDDKGGKVIDLKSAVEARVREEAEKLSAAEDKGKGGGGGGSEGSDSDFIYQCLNGNALGDGILYVSIHRGRFLYNATTGEWLVWEGHRWVPDITHKSLAAVEEVALRYIREADVLGRQLAAITDEAQAKWKNIRRKELLERAKRLRGKNGRDQARDFAATCGEDALVITGERLDAKPFLLACANGVVDLQTGEFRPGQPEDYLTKSSPVMWEGIDTPAPAWEKVLTEIFNGREELISFIQRLFGCAAIGKHLEAIFPVFTGRGRNGKSLVVEIISHVLGGQAGPIPASMLLDQGKTRSSSQPDPDVMLLRGRRAVFASETDDGQKVSPSRIKWLTGNDTICARSPNDKHYTEFEPTHTLFLLTNHVPHAPASDFAFWERTLLVPFEISFVNREPAAENERWADMSLPDRLRAEASGILAWLVKGALLYQAQGLNPPEIVRQATADYRKDEDWLEQFIQECCLVDPDVVCNATRLYHAFSPWFERVISKRVPTQKAFGKLLESRFKKEKKGTVTYVGISLKEGVGG